MTTLLVLVENLNEYLSILEDSGFRLIRAQTPELRAEAIARHGDEIQAVVTRGPLGLFAEEMDALPNLRIICVSGAGYEKVDVAAAQARGIVVTNGAGVNASTVADHAMALLLAVMRDIPQADASVRRGEWRKAMRPSLAGKRLGILGLGAVGLAIARRAAAFDMSIAYHNRRARSDVDYVWYRSVRELAEASDVLVLATPGGANTRHLVDDEVLQALGPQGYLVNIARASVVDTQELLGALREQRIAGAALDVFDDEPNVPDAFKSLANVVLTPHVAGLSPEASHDSVQLVRDNLQAFFAGQPVLTPVSAD
ncbi:2-hydroxyacid dehydrogenase [Pseudomonas sp. 21LCFQ010]|uniref:2-hydroxyacid dehydrogenase n=1 Tax=Pseudomonas sp. 21LCFQ010 TaxID=2957506 RepID=UPI002097FEAB|nr:2-hydroxyacid dehydrogenase [Pseudomonas sp. 21LCFQ010]MCO8165810.1 2-hydroxyacid dehydrogenase [Pseudomonas sp. 21LCFQ010]